MPNKNKNKKNGLYYFAIECRDQRGLVGNMNELIGIVYQEWKAMSKEDREPYNRMACDKHDREKQAREAVALTFDPQVGIKARRNKAAQVIEEMFKQSGFGSFTDFAISQRWFFMKFISFCRCDIESDYYGYFPYFVLGEVGIVEYSLSEGILDSYHTFIKPNAIPQGYLSKCIESSRDYHKIPYKGEENATLVTKSYAEIYKDIYKFVLGEKYDRNNNKSNEKLVPIFSMSEDIDETKFGLKFLQNQAQTDENEKSKRSSSTKSLVTFTPCASYHQYKTSSLSASRSAFTSTTSMAQSFEGMSEHVYDLECLVMEMSLGTITFSRAEDLLTKYSFDYSPNTKCRYHQEEGTINCALGLVKRKAYLISDHICPLYSIDVTPKHLPTHETVGERIVDEMAELTVLFRCGMRTLRHKRVLSPSNSSVAVVDERCEFTVAPCYDIRYPPPTKSTITCDLDGTSTLNDDSFICETKSVKSCESSLFYPESNNANFDSDNYIPIEKKSTISTTTSKQKQGMKTSPSTDSTNIESTTTTSLTTITKATIEEEEEEESTTKPIVSSRKQQQHQQSLAVDSDYQSTVATVLGASNRDDLSVISEEECGELTEGDDWADERDSVIAIAGDDPPNVEALAEFFPTSAAISRGRGRLFSDSSSAI